MVSLMAFNSGTPILGQASDSLVKHVKNREAQLLLSTVQSLTPAYHPQALRMR